MRLRALAALALPLLCAGCGEADEPAPPPRPVLTMTAQPRATEVFGPFTCTIEARYQTQLGFQLAGRMVARDVFVGDAVRAGQRLAALDPTVTQFALLRARADVANAQAQLTNAEGIQSRQQTLASSGSVARATLDNANAGRDTARAQLDQMQAALHVIEDQVGHTELRASFDGVVTTWTAEIGQFVDNGQAIVTVARPDERDAVVDIPDELVGRLSPGLEFTVRLLAAPDVAVRATVREIGPLADDATRSHRVRLTLNDPGPAFRLGTTATVARETAVAPRVHLPEAAVFEADGKRFVWVLAPDGRHVNRRAVTASGTEGGEVAVAEGLQAGDKVVTVGVHSLSEGQEVAGATDVASLKEGRP